MEILEDDHFVYHFTKGKIYRKMKMMTKETGLSKNSFGYHQIGIDGKVKKVHRVLYETFHGTQIPENMMIDHINRIPTDNRISNLRLVTKTQNQQNVTKRLDKFEKNIFWHKQNCKWLVQF